MLRRLQASVLCRWRHWKLNAYPLLKARVEALTIHLSGIFLLDQGLKGPPELRVKILCQVKSDADIIEDWILWHGHLFGFNNVCVIADRATQETKLILKRYSNLCTILEAPLGDWPATLSWCEQKTYNLNSAIQGLRSNADFLIPLDADEFVIFEDKPDRQGVLRELGRLAKMKRNAFKFGQELQSCTLDDYMRPAAEVLTFRRCNLSFDEKKCFAKPSQLSWFGAGQHYVHTQAKEVPLVTRLSLLHFRWRGISHMHRKCLDHVSQEVVLPDGSTKAPRVGIHVLHGAQSIHSGGFRAWARKEIGAPTHIVRGLAEYLSNTSGPCP